MRKLIYYVAVTADGYIAHLDGTHQGYVFEGDHAADLGQRFPETIPTHWQEKLGMKAKNRQFDTVLMGRKTYQVGLKEGVTSPYQSLRQYLFSRSMTQSPDPSVNLIREDVSQVVRRLKQEEGKDIWLCGGGVLAALLFAESLVDEVILKHHPVLFGEGIPLVNVFGRCVSLDLIESKIYSSGVLLLRYRVRTLTPPVAA
jgi:dihydrofolate reductase